MRRADDNDYRRSLVYADCWMMYTIHRLLSDMRQVAQPPLSRMSDRNWE